MHCGTKLKNGILGNIPLKSINFNMEEHENEGEYIISAEVFGNGIDMWLRSQGNYVEVLE